MRRAYAVDGARAPASRLGSPTTRVALVGGTGKLGGIIRDVVEAEPGFELVAVLSSRSSLSDLDGADLVVDASTPAVSIDVVRAAVERGINVLVGTSGWSAERIALIRPLVQASGTGAVFIPNFSLGSVLGSALAAAAAPFFPSVEIIEAHRETKIDSPKCTAVRTAELIAAARTHRRAGRVAARRSASAWSAGRQCAGPLAPPPRGRGTSGDDPVRPGGVAVDRP